MQYRMHCCLCCLPIAYRHDPDISHSNRIFILNDALSNDPLTFQKKISELKNTFAVAKGKTESFFQNADDMYQ